MKTCILQKSLKLPFSKIKNKRGMNGTIYTNHNLTLYLIKLVDVVFMFLSFFIITLILQHKKNNPDQNSLSFPYNDLNITIGTIMYSFHNKTRLATSYNQYGKLVSKYYPNSSYYIMCNTDKSNYKGDPYYPLMNSTSYHHGRFFVLFPMCLDMLAEFNKSRKNKWFLRTTDDVGIDLFELQKYLDHLEKRYDPYKHVVIKGQRSVFYLHGGAGYLFSNAAVVAMLKLIQKFDYSECSYGDDFYWGRFFNFFLDPSDLHTVSFVSQAITSESYKIALGGENYSFPKCRKVDLKSRPQTVAVWHGGNANLEAITEMHILKKKFPENILIQLVNNGNQEFCDGGDMEYPYYTDEDNSTTKITLEEALDKINQTTTFNTHS